MHVSSHLVRHKSDVSRHVPFVFVGLFVDNEPRFVSPHRHRALFNNPYCAYARCYCCCSCGGLKAKRPGLNQSIDQPTPMYFHTTKREEQLGREGSLAGTLARIPSALVRARPQLRSAVLDDGLPLHKRTFVCESASSGHLVCERRSTCGIVDRHRRIEASLSKSLGGQVRWWHHTLLERSDKGRHRCEEPSSIDRFVAGWKNKAG